MLSLVILGVNRMLHALPTMFRGFDRVAIGGNSHSQLVSGLHGPRGLNGGGLQTAGDHMNDIELALLRALALRPMQTVSAALQPVVTRLHEAGYVAHSTTGWMATEKGCVTLEELRPRPR